MHIAGMLYVTYTKPFNTHIRNFACIFTEIGLVALHGTLFAFLTNGPHLGEEHYIFYAKLFAIFVLIIVC